MSAASYLFDRPRDEPAPPAPHAPTLGEIFRHYGPAYRERHGDRLTADQRRALDHVATPDVCRTPPSARTARDLRPLKPLAVRAAAPNHVLTSYPSPLRKSERNTQRHPRRSPSTAPAPRSRFASKSTDRNSLDE